jgi:hypothetical protein
MASIMPCNLWAEKLATRHVEDLSAVERADLNMHVATCPNCAEVRRQYDILSARIYTLPPVEPFPQNSAELPWNYGQHMPSQRKNAIGLQKPFSRKAGIGLAFLAALCIIAVSLGLVSQFSASPQKLVSNKATPGNNEGCLLSASENNTCSASYTGKIFNSQSHNTSTMFLSLQQNQQNITGSYIFSPPFLIANIPITGGPISGNVHPNREIIFTIRNNEFDLSLQFTGTIQTNGSMSGTIRFSNKQIGTWSVS